VRGEFDELSEAVRALAVAARTRDPEIAQRAERLAERLSARRFHVAVLGEFKRGKSTLIDALVGARVVPTGALPVTAVPTELHYGDGPPTVVHLDGSTRQLGSADELPDFVTEEGNPGNARGVARVEVPVPAPLLRTGLVLVDTPGTRSGHRHGDEAADRTVLDADGAVVVLSAEAPLSEEERALVRRLSEKGAPTFYVLNKADHLHGADLDAARSYVESGIEDLVGRPVRLFAVAALRALEAKLSGREPSPSEAGEFGELERTLRSFATEDLASTRSATARTELARLASELRASLDITAAALALDAASLDERVRRFRDGADAERRAFADARTLLARDVDALARRVADDLSAFARGAARRRSEALAEVAATVPRRRLEEELGAAIERFVEEDFEAFRRAQAASVEGAWRSLAGATRARLEARVDALRELAADLFDVVLPKAVIPALDTERERFFYLFLHLEGSAEGLGRLARRVLPAGLARRLALRTAERRLAEEYDRHAGRARADLTDRLVALRRRFEAAMAEELERSIASVVEAARRAEDLRAAVGTEHARRLAEDREIRRVLDAALAVAGSSSRARHPCEADRASATS
jgi:small GTP-binding protein